MRLKLGVFLTGYTVAILTYYVGETTIACSPMFRHLFDVIIVCLTDKEEYGSVKVEVLQSDGNQYDSCTLIQNETF